MAANSLLGGLVGVIGGKSTDDKLEQVPYWKRYEPALNAIIKGIGGNQWKDALAKYTASQDAYAPIAQANVAKYNEQFQNLFNDQYNPIADYERIRSGNISSLGDYSKNVLDYGLGRIKGQLAAGGYGNTGPSSYDRILNSTVTASNIAPVLNTIYGNLGRDTSLMAAANQDKLNRQLGLLSSDYLNAPADAASQRAFNPFLAQRQLQGVDLDLLGRAGELQRANVAGWQTIPGLKSRIDAADEGVWNTVKNAASVYGSLMGTGSLGGMMGGMGGGGGSQQQLANNEAARFSQDLTSQGYLSPNSTYAPVMRDLYPTTSTANTYGQSFNPSAFPYTSSRMENPYNPYNPYRLY